MRDFPFTEKKIKKNIFIREFDNNVDSKELVWHRDKEDRIVEVLNNEDWFFQLDNELPKKLEGRIFIPKETFHRVIKGSGNLTIRITKLYT